MLIRLALVLNAHLPYVREAQPFTPQERWLHEALWECYLPLCKTLQSLSKTHRGPLLTLSVSPTLADMLADAVLQRRFVRHIEQVRSINAHLQHTGAGRLSAVRGYYQQRLDDAVRHFEQLGADVLGHLRHHATGGSVELLTSSVSHAYLPAWRHAPGAVAMQLALARQWPHETMTGRGFWLPEMATAPQLDQQLLAHGYRYTLVDDHALQLAVPRVRPGRAAMGARGLIYLARNRHCNEQVWSRANGYPSHPSYREFYRDVGYSATDPQLGKLGRGSMTGLKYYRIEQGDGGNLPYQPEVAQRQAIVHAAEFVDNLKRFGGTQHQGVIVAAYDAELFGHWWHEGPLFLREVLRLAIADPEIELTTPSRYLNQNPIVALAEPGTSSWGRGGYGAPWTGRLTARWWRPLHETHRIVRRATFRAEHRTGAAGAALDRAIVELLLLQSSDWLFMLNEGGKPARYAHQRLLEHGEAARYFSRMAENPSLASREQAARARHNRPFMRHLDRGLLRRAAMAE